MRINIAGYNVDLENIMYKENITPETICVSYARISRDGRDIDKLREEARKDIERTRKSNENIVFGMGHSSIAEHCVFNIDVMDISRLLSEELEKARLVSFTEKSQRYVKVNSYIIPKEIERDEKILEKYKSLMNELFNKYEYYIDKLKDYFKEKYKDKKENEILNLAKEDARYILPLSTITQLGMTINARNLEKIIRKFRCKEVEEFKDFSKELYDKVKNITPSLIKYIEPERYEKDNLDFIFGIVPDFSIPERDVELIDYDYNFVDNIIAGYIVRKFSIDYKKAKDMIRNKNRKWKEDIIKEMLRNLTKFSSLKREFELVNFRFGILLSASAFAQLKRHRITTIIDGEYCCLLGVKIPNSIKECGLECDFKSVINRVEDFYYEIKDKYSNICNYVLTNSHRKNIILQVNLRELTHITRLRCDKTAQWDIREICNKMVKEVEEINPFISKILCGKDEFDNKFKF